MPLFVMIGWDGPQGTELRAKHRDAHAAYVTGLNDNGCIQFAGPIKSDSGEKSIGVVIVYKADGLDAGRKLVDEDPYVSAGVFGTLTVNPYKQVFPNPS